MSSINVKYVKRILEDVLRVLDNFEDANEIETRQNTYGISVPYLSTTYGFIPLKNIEDYILSDEEDDYPINDSKKPIKLLALKKHLNESNNYFRRAVNFWTGYNLDYSQRRIAELIGDCLKDCMKAEGGDFEDKLYLYDTAISRLIHTIFSNDVRERSAIAKDIERIVGRCIEDESLAFECTDNILSILEQSYW